MLLTCVLAHTASATSISLAGSWSYQYPQGNGATVVLSVDRITNNATSGHSGTLRMELWAFATPYAGTSQSGYQLATYQLDTLNAGASLTAVASGNISASFPPTGAWNIALLLSEFNGSSWITQTYALTRITNTLACSAGSCSVVVGPGGGGRLPASAPAKPAIRSMALMNWCSQASFRPALQLAAKLTSTSRRRWMAASSII